MTAHTVVTTLVAAALCLVITSTSAGLIPAVHLGAVQPEYQLAISYRDQQGYDSSLRSTDVNQPDFQATSFERQTSKSQKEQPEARVQTNEPQKDASQVGTYRATSQNEASSQSSQFQQSGNKYQKPQISQYQIESQSGGRQNNQYQSNNQALNQYPSTLNDGIQQKDFQTSAQQDNQQNDVTSRNTATSQGNKYQTSYQGSQFSQGESQGSQFTQGISQGNQYQAPLQNEPSRDSQYTTVNSQVQQQDRDSSITTFHGPTVNPLQDYSTNPLQASNDPIEVSQSAENAFNPAQGVAQHITLGSPQQQVNSRGPITTDSVSYAYHGQSQHAVEGSLSNGIAVGTNIRAYPVEVTHHFSELSPAQVTLYHPEGEVVGVSQDSIGPAYLHHEPTGVLAPQGATLLQPATYAQYAPVHSVQPVREQTFSVNVASSKYGYGYTVRGIQHGHH